MRKVDDDMNTEKKVCQICKEEFDNNKKLISHIRFKHNMSSKDYYDKYLRKEGDGICPVCGKPTKFRNISLGYTENCSSSCAQKNPKTQEKISNTVMSKYGVKSVLQSEKVKDKIKQTNLKRYGHENPLGSEKIKKKARQTMLDKYGVKNPMQSEELKQRQIQSFFNKYGVINPGQSKEIREKVKATNLKKIGYECNFQSSEIRAQIAETNLKKYGHENPFGSKAIREEIKKTFINKYGVDNPWKSEEVKNKIKQTNLSKYGVECSSQAEEVKERIRATNLEKYGVEHPRQAHINDVDNWLNLEEFIMSNPNAYNYIDLAKRFNLNKDIVRKKIIDLNLQDYIKDFYRLSNPEAEFKDKLDNMLPSDIKYIMHDRKQIKPLELDFYFPDSNLAIEISPTHTHQYIGPSDRTYYGVTSKEYHYDKFKLCEDNGIELITLFDWEEQDKVLDLIKNKLVQSNNRVYARNCLINYSSKITKEHREFLDKCHVLGKINNKKDCFVLELKHNDNIMGIAVFYPYKNNQLELKRLAFKESYTIVGGASKLIKNAFEYKNEAKDIITFSDNNLGTGSVYRTIGFKLKEDNKFSLIYYNPEYNWAIKDTSLWMIGADRLLKAFPGYEEVGIGDNLPRNDEIVMSYGFVPIYDCGYRKWVYSKSE